MGPEDAGPCRRRAICWVAGLDVGFGTEGETANPGLGACRKLVVLFHHVGFPKV